MKFDPRPGNAGANIVKKILATAALLTSLVPLGCKMRSDISGQRNLRSAATVESTPACQAACTDVSDESNWAVCYSCRCKAAMDGWLPSPAEVSCDAAKEIPVYQAVNTPNGTALQKITKAEDECFNPPRLREAQKEKGGCIPGSKLGQLKRGDIWAKWICRREHVHDRLFDPTVNYDDHGMILFNEKTGATCFFDDMDGVTNGTNNPDIDITSGDPKKVTDFMNSYYRQEGGSCIGCHDNDPFMYSPYVKAAGWETSEAYTLGKYFAVHTVEKEKSHVVSLTAEKAAPCLGCHRIGQSNTCRIFAMDSAGINPPPGLHKWLKTPPPTGIAVSPDGDKWNFPKWMPTNEVQQDASDDSWRRDYGEAVETIRTCCSDHNAPGCTWEEQ